MAGGREGGGWQVAEEVEWVEGGRGGGVGGRW